MHESFDFSTLSSILLSRSSFIVAILVCVKQYFIVVLICISQMNTFSCAYWPFVYLLLWNVCPSLVSLICYCVTCHHRNEGLTTKPFICSLFYDLNWAHPAVLLHHQAKLMPHKPRQITWPNPESGGKDHPRACILGGIVHWGPPV